MLDRLQKQGLVSIAADKGVRRYVAVAPEHLERAAKERVENARLTQQALKSLMPEIRTLAKHERHRPRMRAYDGVTGLKMAFEETLESREKLMRVFSSTKDIYTSLPGYLPWYVLRRLRRGIKMVGIHPDEAEVVETLRRVPKIFDDLTVIPKKDWGGFPSDFAIFDNQVAFMSHRPPFAVAIESESIAEAAKVLFDLALAEARRRGFDPRNKHG